MQHHHDQQSRHPTGTHQLRQLRHAGDHIAPVAVPLCAGVAQQVKLAEVDVVCQAGSAGQTGFGNKVCSKIQPFQGLATLEVLDYCDVVQGQAEVAQLLQKRRTSATGLNVSA